IDSLAKCHAAERNNWWTLWTSASLCFRAIYKSAVRPGCRTRQLVRNENGWRRWSFRAGLDHWEPLVECRHLKRENPRRLDGLKQSFRQAIRDRRSSAAKRSQRSGQSDWVRTRSEYHRLANQSRPRFGEPSRSLPWTNRVP